MLFIISFVTFGIVFALIDAVWLTASAKLYRDKLSHVMRDKPNLIAAVVFYIIYVFGVTYFGLHPAVEAHNIGAGLLGAGLLAFIAYATYDLTNLATIKKWPVRIVIIDMIWGTLATTVSTGIAYIICVHIFGL